MENRDADNFAYAMALGPRIGPLGEVVGVRGLAVHGSHADFNRLLEPTPRLAIQVTPSSVRLQADDLCVRSCIGSARASTFADAALDVTCGGYRD